MGALSAAARDLSKKSGVNSFRPPERKFLELAVSNAPGKFFPAVRAVMRLVQKRWKTKPTAQLAYLTGATDRTCRNWINGDGDIPSSALIALLHTEHGFEFLSEVMRGTNVKWFARLRDQVAAANRAAKFAKEMQAVLPLLEDESNDREGRDRPSVARSPNDVRLKCTSASKDTGSST